MTISVDQNLVAAIVQIYRRIHGRDPDEATIVFWLDRIKSGRATLATVELSEQQAQEIDTETAEVLEYQDSENTQDSWSVASVAEVSLGLGGGGAAGVGAGSIAAAVGGIAAAAGGGGGGGSTGTSIPTQNPSESTTSPNQKPPSTENTNVTSSGGSSRPSSVASGSSEPPSSDQSIESATQQSPSREQTTPPDIIDTDSNGPFPSTELPKKTFITDPVQLFVGGSEYWLGDMYFQDLNGDGVDEIIVAGRMTQPATEENWLYSNLFILGWNTGKFAVENDIWFSNNADAVTIGTEPSVMFGDFDGDGRTDISVASSTDGVFSDNGPNLIFFNDINGLTRTEVSHVTTGVHGHVVADFNNDGVDDIFYISWPQGGLVLGNAERSFDSVLSGFASGSSVVAGDFLNDGTVQVIITDYAHTSNSDTNLFRLRLDPINDSFSLELISELPRERFYLAQWDHAPYVRASGQEPHSVRSIAMDFDQDELLDVVIITSANDSDGSWHRYTEIQFLKNLGAGSFADVTSDVLVGFNHDTVPSYAPRLIDVNNDGVLDIWLGSQDYRGAEDSNRVLISDPLGQYIDSWAKTLEEFRDDIGGNKAPVHLTISPDGDQYLLSMAWDTGSPTTFHISPLQDYFIS